MRVLPEWVRSRSAWAVFLAAGGFLLFAALVAAGSPLRGPASLILSPLVASLAVIACAQVAADAGLDAAVRRTWGFFAATYAAYTLGDVMFALIAANLVTPTDPRLDDLAYTSSYAFMLSGLLFLPSAPVRPGERVRFALDLATVLTGSTMVVWAALIVPAAANHPTDTWAQVFAAAPIVGDLVLIFALSIVLLRGPAPSTRAALGFAIASVLAGALADVWYPSGLLARDYAEGQAVDLLWMLGSGFMILGAVRQRHGEETTRGAPMGRVWDQIGSVLPYLGMALGFGMLVRLAVRGGEPQLGVAIGAALLCALIVARQAHLLAENRQLHDRLAEEFDKSERLLLNVLPSAIVARLKRRPDEPIADHVPAVTVLFADLVGFTTLSTSTPPADLLALLNAVFSRFDQIAEAHGLEKIKTIGDAYMAASGLTTPRDDHASAALSTADAMIAAIEELNQGRAEPLQIRVGLHSGPVVAGVIGRHKFSYDLWGDTVNTASRMESHGIPGRVHLSDATRAYLGDRDLESRGTIEIKGKGAMTTWLSRKQIQESG